MEEKFAWTIGLAGLFNHRHKREKLQQLKPSF